MRKITLTFAFIVVCTGVHAGDDGTDYGNPVLDARFDACIKGDEKRAPLFQQMLKPPYSCDRNMETQNRIARATELYKERYEKVRNFMASNPRLVQECQQMVVRCIDATPGIAGENKMREFLKVAGPWYSSSEK